MTTRIFIDGEAGTTGLQIRDRLKNRLDLEILSVDAAWRKDETARRVMLNEADIAILCLPDEAARQAVALIDPQARTRVLDASSAFRTAEGWVYGMVEMDGPQRQKIAEARRLTNPGCWPQGFIALLRPLIRAGIVASDYTAFYHGVSGYTGGGRKMIESYEQPDHKSPPYMPYGLGFQHKHLPEMQRYSGLIAAPLFEPAVGAFAQGMLSSIPLHTSQLAKRVTAADVRSLLVEAYGQARFVEVAESDQENELNPETLNGTNRMRLHVFGNEATGQLLLMAIYDNLGKGASGAAVQNLNIMIGADEASSVDLALGKA